MPLRTYEVNVKGQKWQNEILHVTAGGAKYRYLLRVQEAYPEITFRHLTCRSLGAVTQRADLTERFKKRGIPFAELGMRVQMAEDFGAIVGMNSSENLEVLFTSGRSKGSIQSCHPHFMIRYFDHAGELIQEFNA